MKFIDSHCHLNMLDLAPFGDKLGNAIVEAMEQGVTEFLTVCTQLSEFEQLHAIAKEYPQIYCSVGVHPHNDEKLEVTAEDLLPLAKREKVVALGETGLDYYYEHENRIIQQQNFIAHIEVAKAVQKPLIIHTRQAPEDTLKILEEQDAKACGGVMHCFTESWEVAKAALDLGFYISISGIVTFKKAEQVQAVAKQVPLDRLLIETDSPYLAPVPFRGKSNHPALVRYVAEFIAELRGVELEALAEATTHNFHQLFKQAVV